MSKFLILLFVLSAQLSVASGAIRDRKQAVQKPKLIVNIVIGELREAYIDKYAENLSANGFLRFLDQGTSFSQASYGFMQTITPATLTTLFTGTNPSSHGIVSEYWMDYISNKNISLIQDNSIIGVGCDEGLGCYSPANLTVPTLSDMLGDESVGSKAISIATSAISSIVMGGFSKDVYWVDSGRFSWVSSSAYMLSLPEWVVKYNSLRLADDYLNQTWEATLSEHKYVNKDKSILSEGGEAITPQGLLHTPTANTLVAEFAKQAMVYEELGKDDNTDILNIHFETPSLISQMYGASSMEYEDMLYRLDGDLANMIDFIESQIGASNVLFVLTSDHGTSQTSQNKMFNTVQFRVLLNSFLGAQYGSGDWVLGYYDRQLYLNRNLIYKKSLSIEEVQNRAAAFTLQLRGVSHVLTSTAMQSSYFAASYAQKMQNSFYPKRGGDLILNLMPGWAEESSAKSMSGSMYDYDTYVPLMFYGSSVGLVRVTEPVDMKDVAPTLASIMHINKPVASTGKLIEPLLEQF